MYCFHLLAAGFLLGLIFDPEDRSIMFPQNVTGFYCTTWHYNSEHCTLYQCPENLFCILVVFVWLQFLNKHHRHNFFYYYANNKIKWELNSVCCQDNGLIQKGRVKLFQMVACGTAMHFQQVNHRLTTIKTPRIRLYDNDPTVHF
jgi:hypothetical protein